MDHRSSIMPNTILDYWRIIQRYRRMIVRLVVVSVLITGIISKFYLPKLYEAKATLFPVREDSFGGSGLSLSGGGGGGSKEKGGGGATLAMEALGGKSSGPTIMDILQALAASRRMAEAVIDQLNLTSYYETGSKIHAAAALLGEMSFKPTSFKSLEVTVLTKDPKMAADIANTSFETLDRLYREHVLSATKRNRVFIEARLLEKEKQLGKAEEALKEFQTKHRSLVISEQAEAAMKSAAELHGQIVALEVELAALREYATPSNPMVNKLEVQIQELRRQLDQLEQRPAKEIMARRQRAPMSRQLFPAFEEAPTLALNLLRLIRQVKVEEAVYGMLVGMLEQAKIAALRDVPMIQVLDVAIPPEQKSKPKTLQNILVAGVISFLLGILVAIFLDQLERFRAGGRVLGHQAKRLDEGAAFDSNGNGDEGEVHPVSPKETERFHGRS